MAKSYVITNNEKLKRFFRFGGKLNDVVVRVGILTGKTKYPKGHRGSKSDRDWLARGARRIDPRELARRAQVRRAKRHLAEIESVNVRKLELKRIREAFREQGISSRGLARKKAGAVAVAKVAGVLGSFARYHSHGIRSLGFKPTGKSTGRVVLPIANIHRTLMDTRDPTPALKALGINAKNAVRQRLVAAGHVDTGKLLRNTQYEIISASDKKRFDAEAKAERARARAERKRRRGAR